MGQSPCTDLSKALQPSKEAYWEFCTGVRRTIVIAMPLNHDHTSGMTLEEVVDERDDHDDSRWWGSEGQSCESLDE